MILMGESGDFEEWFMDPNGGNQFIDECDCEFVWCSCIADAAGNIHRPLYGPGSGCRGNPDLELKDISCPSCGCGEKKMTMEEVLRMLGL